MAWKIDEIEISIHVNFKH